MFLSAVCDVHHATARLARPGPNVITFTIVGRLRGFDREEHLVAGSRIEHHGPVVKLHEVAANGLPATSLTLVVNVTVYLVLAASVGVGLSVPTRVVEL